MTLLAKMDRLVGVLGLERLIFMKFEPRTFRWAPLFVLAALVAGYVIMATASGFPDSSLFAGWALFYGAFGAAAFLRLFGPRFTPTAPHPLDEREIIVKARAHAMSGIVLAGCAMLGCFYMATEDVPELWHPHGMDWVHLGFAFQAGGMLLPTWIASWLEPRPVPEHEA